MTRCFSLLLLQEWRQFTLQQSYAHTYRYYTCLMMMSVCMLGHGDWVLLVLFTHACTVQQHAMKKHWWSGFKEPWLLFQHQKVHLRASVIFHPFPQLRLGYIMMSNSFSVSHPRSIHQSFILTSPLQPPQSISVLAVSRSTPMLCCIYNKPWLLPKTQVHFKLSMLLAVIRL